MPNHYWSCTKFADWVRGTPKGKAKGVEDWEEWTKEAQRYNPIRFWLAETALDQLAKVVFFIPDTLYSIKYYINNRWVTKTHCLTANPQDLKPGIWTDVGYRFLPCLFNELVDFVEIELAWSHVSWADKEVQKKYKMPFWGAGWFRWRTWRCPQAGLDSLEWQRNLVYDDNWKPFKKGQPTLQAINAKEILDLYTWWTQVYRNRPDPYEVSGWSDVCEARRVASGDKFCLEILDPKLKKQHDKAHKLLQKIEAENEKEDEEMMIRLIKIRNALWT